MCMIQPYIPTVQCKTWLLMTLRWIRPSASLAAGHRTPTWPWTHPKQNQCFTALVRCSLTTPSHHMPYIYQCKEKIWNAWNLQSFSSVHLNENLKWDEHVKHLASSCYGTLACLQKTKNFTPYKLRKHLAESLILSRLDVNAIIFCPLTEHLINRLQHVQYSTASFITGNYVTNSVYSLFKLDWLPMREHWDWHL